MVGQRVGAGQVAVADQVGVDLAAVAAPPAVVLEVGRLPPPGPQRHVVVGALLVGREGHAVVVLVAVDARAGGDQRVSVELRVENKATIRCNKNLS